MARAALITEGCVEGAVEKLTLGGSFVAPRESEDREAYRRIREEISKKEDIFCMVVESPVLWSMF